MMGLVDKLRNYAKRYAADDAERLLMSDAANEMERIQKENLHYRSAINTISAAATHPPSLTEDWNAPHGNWEETSGAPGLQYHDDFEAEA